MSILDKATVAILLKQHLQIKSRWISRNYQVESQHVILTAVEKAGFGQSHVFGCGRLNRPPYVMVKENELAARNCH